MSGAKIIAGLEEANEYASTRNVARRLRDLAHPMAEAMSDRARLDAFVSAGIDAANALDELLDRYVDIKQGRFTNLPTQSR